MSVTVAEFRVHYVFENADLSDAEGKDKALQEVRPIIEGVDPRDFADTGEPMQDFLLAFAAYSVGIEEDTLRDWWGWDKP